MNDFVKDMIICLIIFCAGVLFYPVIKWVETPPQEIVNSDTSIVKSSEEDLQFYFEKHKIRFSHIVMAQAILESDSFKSKVYRTNNNFMGMKVAAQRYSFATNPHDFGSYAKYENIEDCVRDIKSWQIASAFFITKDEDYFALLQKIYAEDPNYINKLKKLIK